MNTTKLFYFRGRGRAEMIRMVLNFLEIDYQDVFIETSQDFAALKNQNLNPFEQVPILELDGQHFSQTAAIIRHLARQHKINGESNFEVYCCDQLASGILDWQQHYFNAIFNALKRPDYFEVKLPKYLKIYETLLSKDNHLLINKQINYPDLMLFEIILNNLDFSEHNILSGYPKLSNFVELIKALPQLTKYLSSEKRLPFPNAENNYVNKVKTITNPAGN